MPLNASFARGLSLSHAIPNGYWLAGQETRITSCCSVADKCEPGDLFVALDDREFVSQEQLQIAIGRGAVAVLAERPLPCSVPQYVVDDCRVAFGQLCHGLAGSPSHSLRTIGIAGSCGKSTTERLLAAILRAAGQSAESLPSDPIERHGPLHIARWMAEVRSQGGTHATLEASSQALAQHKMRGLQLDAAVITNIHREYAEPHGSLRNYQNAISSVVEHLKPEGFTVINADDRGSYRLLRDLDVPTITIGLREEGEITANLLERHPSEQTFLIDAGDESIVVRTQIIGDAHIYNCLQAAAVGLVLGLDPGAIVKGLEAVTSVPGCLQRLECGQPYGVYIDQAKTPHALSTALQTLRRVTSGQLRCALGVDPFASEQTRTQLGQTLERLTDRLRADRAEAGPKTIASQRP